MKRFIFLVWVPRPSGKGESDTVLVQVDRVAETWELLLDAPLGWGFAGVADRPLREYVVEFAVEVQPLAVVCDGRLSTESMTVVRSQFTEADFVEQRRITEIYRSAEQQTYDSRDPSTSYAEEKQRKERMKR